MKYYIYNYENVSEMYKDKSIPEKEILFHFEYDGKKFLINDKEMIYKDKYRKKCISEFSKWIRQFNRHRKYVLLYSNIGLFENDCYDLLSDYLPDEANESGETFAEIICKSDNIKKTVDEIIRSLVCERLDVSSRDLLLEIKNEGNDYGLDIQRVKEEIQEVRESIYNKTFRWMV